MDGDLQHDPAEIPDDVLETMDQTGADIVSGWRQKRVDNYILRRLPSRVANWMMAKLSGVDIHDFGTTFKVYRRETIKDVPLYGEMHRFIPALGFLERREDRGSADQECCAAGSGSRITGFRATVRVFFDIIYDISVFDAVHDAAFAFLWAPGDIGHIFGRADPDWGLMAKTGFVSWHEAIFVEHGSR